MLTGQFCSPQCRVFDTASCFLMQQTCTAPGAAAAGLARHGVSDMCAGQWRSNGAPVMCRGRWSRQAGTPPVNMVLTRGRLDAAGLALWASGRGGWPTPAAHHMFSRRRLISEMRRHRNRRPKEAHGVRRARQRACACVRARIHVSRYRCRIVIVVHGVVDMGRTRLAARARHAALGRPVHAR